MQAFDPRIAAIMNPGFDRRPALPPLVVLADRAWGRPFKRLEEVLVRLARDFPVIVVEPALFDANSNRLDSGRVVPGVELWTPQLRLGEDDFQAGGRPALAALVTDAIAERGIADPFVWLCAGVTSPEVADLEPRALICDGVEARAPASGDVEAFAQADILLVDDPSSGDVAPAPLRIAAGGIDWDDTAGRIRDAMLAFVRPSRARTNAARDQGPVEPPVLPQTLPVA